MHHNPDLHGCDLAQLVTLNLERLLDYSIMITGVVEDGFTSAEIYRGDYQNDDRVARVFELEAGWYVEIHDLQHLQDPALVATLLEARDELLHYVNRTGAGEAGWPDCGWTGNVAYGTR